MTDTLTQLMNGRGFSAPIRNRYFYGKLLDVHHLEMEQRYFLEMGRLVNRLTLGSGVLCGLHVRPGDEAGTVIVSPGVAVDGHGREIVVTESVTLDLGKLETDEDDETGGGRALAERDPAVEIHASAGQPVAVRGGTVLCLSYHECDIEPAPVLVADCDLREDCVPGAVRERFKFTLMSAAHAPLPEDPCSITRGLKPAHFETTGDRTHEIERALVSHLDYVGSHASQPGVGVAAALRQQLCSVYQPPCRLGSDCVPIALIGKGSDGISVEECLPRRTIYSNAVLLDLILCLAERIEECCGRTVTVTAPKVVQMWPPPPSQPATPGETATPTEVKLAEFDTQLDMPDGGIAISFDRAMNAERLAQPDEWLRVMLLPDAQRRVGVALRLELRDTADNALSGGEGQTANYRFAGTLGQLGNVGTNTGLRELLQKLEAKSAWVLVMMRSDDVTQIAALDDAELLDADFHGTALTGEACDMLWTFSILSATLAPTLAAAISTPPTPMPALPSGNGIEGGVFHSSFHITL
jgi:hypothetical protein